MIELIDGSVTRRWASPDMRHAIQYALTYPERHSCDLPSLDLTALASLHFEQPDLDRFPCIALAYRALRTGGTLPAAMNAANEEAVAFYRRAYLPDRYTAGHRAVMDNHCPQPLSNLDTVLETDRDARLAALTEIEKLTNNRRIGKLTRFWAMAT